ncbi:hypothetical protein LTR74_012875 [Friedmanniomyces endolithicus]|nr:hypothetical protein LTR74_012875 [Friedmanniomyces endolithicus]
MGFLNSLFHGCTLVLPNDDFDPEKTVSALIDEKCTAVLSVPTMFLAQLNILESRKAKLNTVRTGLAAGSTVPEAIMKRIRSEMGCDGMLIAYGMTETSPVTFMTALDDPDHLRTTSLGRILPHSAAKIIDEMGNIVPRGTRGELCTSGYALQKGYWQNQDKTDEVMRRDAEGVLWMHTGDECYIDDADYCFITGRLKDLIIRGGENIHPREIEDRLLEHEAIAEVSIVAIKDERYGETVGAFLRSKSGGGQRPSDGELKGWVQKILGRHKAPAHVFWIGDEGVGSDFPKTASGKLQKHIMSALGTDIARRKGVKAKL